MSVTSLRIDGNNASTPRKDEILLVKDENTDPTPLCQPSPIIFRNEDNCDKYCLEAWKDDSFDQSLGLPNLSDQSVNTHKWNVGNVDKYTFITRKSTSDYDTDKEMDGIGDSGDSGDIGNDNDNDKETREPTESSSRSSQFSYYKSNGDDGMRDSDSYHTTFGAIADSQSTSDSDGLFSFDTLSAEQSTSSSSYSTCTSSLNTGEENV